MIFVHDMILLITNMVDLELICQKKQTQLNKDNTRGNRHRVEYGYKVGDNVMLTNHTAYKYETPYKVRFLIKKVFYQWYGKFTMWCSKN